MVAKLLDAKDKLGYLPDDNELRRLAEYYPSYEWDHRFRLLHGYFEGKSVREMVSDKLEAKGVVESECSKQSIGGHSRWVVLKVKKTIIRILYLRYRLDQGMSQRKANQRLLKDFGSEKNTQDGGQSNIRDTTHSPVLNVPPTKLTIQFLN